MTTYWQTIYKLHQLGAYVTPSTQFFRNRLASRASFTLLFLQKAVYRLPTVICLFKQATVNLISFPSRGQTGLVSFNELLKCCRKFSFQYNGLLYCRACVRSEAYTALFARKGKSFFTRHTREHLIRRFYIRSVYCGSRADEQS